MRIVYSVDYDGCISAWIGDVLVVKNENGEIDYDEMDRKLRNTLKSQGIVSLIMKDLIKYPDAKIILMAGSTRQDGKVDRYNNLERKQYNGSCFRAMRIIMEQVKEKCLELNQSELFARVSLDPLLKHDVIYSNPTGTEFFQASHQAYSKDSVRYEELDENLALFYFDSREIGELKLLFLALELGETTNNPLCRKISSVHVNNYKEVKFTLTEVESLRSLLDANGYKKLSRKLLIDRQYFDNDNGKHCLLYMQMQYITNKCVAQGNSTDSTAIVFKFFDDRVDIIIELLSFFKKNTHLIPKQVSLCLHQCVLGYVNFGMENKETGNVWSNKTDECVKLMLGSWRRKGDIFQRPPHPFLGFDNELPFPIQGIGILDTNYKKTILELGFRPYDGLPLYLGLTQKDAKVSIKTAVPMI